MSCSECNRTEPKPWPIFTVNYHGTEVCAKCLAPIKRAFYYDDGNGHMIKFPARGGTTE